MSSELTESPQFRALFSEENSVPETSVRILTTLLPSMVAAVIGLVVPVTCVLRCKRNIVKARRLAARIRRSCEFAAIRSGALCIFGGQLLALVLFNLLPTIRSLIHSDEMQPNAEIFLCTGFLASHLFHEVVASVFLRIFDANDHLYFVQFIHRATYKPRPKTPSVEDMKKNVDQAQTDLISLEDSTNLEKKLDICEEAALELQDYARNEFKRPCPAMRSVAYWEERRDYLKCRELSWRVKLDVAILWLPAVLSGLCAGLQTDHGVALLVLWCLLCHRCMVAISTGIELLTMRFDLDNVASVICLYSLVVPFGGVLGAAIAWCRIPQEYMALAMGLSAGSILYTAIFECLREDKKTSLKQPGQSFGVAMGFIIYFFFHTLIKLEPFIYFSH